MAKSRRRTSEQRIADRRRRIGDKAAADLDWARSAASFWSRVHAGQLPDIGE